MQLESVERHFGSDLLNKRSLVDISDHNLDLVISRIQQSFPNSGLVMVQGHLLSEGVHVPRQRV